MQATRHRFDDDAYNKPQPYYMFINTCDLIIESTCSGGGFP